MLGRQIGGHLAQEARGGAVGFGILAGEEVGDAARGVDRARGDAREGAEQRKHVAEGRSVVSGGGRERRGDEERGKEKAERFHAGEDNAKQRPANPSYNLKKLQPQEPWPHRVPGISSAGFARSRRTCTTSAGARSSSPSAARWWPSARASRASSTTSTCSPRSRSASCSCTARACRSRRS